MTTEVVRIRYRRPPSREDVFVQTVVHRDREVVVTYNASTPLVRPLVLGGETALEPGSPAVWFTFPGAAHDIGRFHLRDGAFTGIYANVLTPVRFASPAEWETTDLFLDVWLPPDGRPVLLDAEELDAAEAAGWVSGETAAGARAEADRLLTEARTGAWPPPVVGEWPLERVLERLEIDRCRGSGNQ